MRTRPVQHAHCAIHIADAQRAPFHEELLHLAGCWNLRLRTNSHKICHAHLLPDDVPRSSISPISINLCLCSRASEVVYKQYEQVKAVLQIPIQLFPAITGPQDSSARSLGPTHHLWSMAPRRARHLSSCRFSMRMGHSLHSL